MGLPPRPKDRALVRRAIVASLLVTAGCDQGTKAVPHEHVANPTGGGGGGPDPVAPQVAYVNGFTLEIVDETDTPITGLRVKVTIDRGGGDDVTTSDRGDAYITARIEGDETVTVEAPGYEPGHGRFEGGMSPSARVVLKKKEKP